MKEARVHIEKENSQQKYEEKEEVISEFCILKYILIFLG